MDESGRAIIFLSIKEGLTIHSNRTKLCIADAINSQTTYIFSLPLIGLSNNPPNFLSNLIRSLKLSFNLMADFL